MTPPNSFKESWKEALPLLRSFWPQIWPSHQPRAPPHWPLLEVKIEVWILDLAMSKGKFQAAFPHSKRFSLHVLQKVLGRTFWWSGGPGSKIPSEGPKPNRGPPWTHGLHLRQPMRPSGGQWRLGRAPATCTLPAPTTHAHPLQAPGPAATMYSQYTQAVHAWDTLTVPQQIAAVQTSGKQ